MLEKTESLLRRMRWKEFFSTPPRKETFGLNTTKKPMPVPEMSEFENKMQTLVQSETFKQHNMTFKRNYHAMSKASKRIAKSVRTCR